MRLRGFAVFDVAAGFFQEPFFVPSVGIALRGFTDAVNNPENAIGKHPEDFRLFQIGEYDQQTGMLVSLAQPELIGNATEYKREGR